MKQPSASSQWKLPLWVPTRLRGAWLGEEVEKEGEETAAVAVVLAIAAMKGKGQEKQRFLWKLKSFWLNPFVANENISKRPKIVFSCKRHKATPVLPCNIVASLLYLFQEN